MRLKRYTKSLAALVVGLAAAAALLPTDADPRLLAAGVVLNTFVVWYAKNAPPDPPRRFPPPAPTRWQRGGPLPGGYGSGDTPASQLRPPASGTRPPPPKS